MQPEVEMWERDFQIRLLSSLKQKQNKKKKKAPSPDAVKDVAVLEYPKQLVVRRDLVKVGSLFICKEQVGFPNGVQHGGVEIQRVIWILLVRQARVVPLLPQKYIEPVVLQTRVTFLSRLM